MSLKAKHTEHFTLVELLIAIMAFALFAAAVAAALPYFFSEVKKGQLQTGLQRDADLAAYWIEQTVAEGSRVRVETPAAEHLIVEKFNDGNKEWTREVYKSGSGFYVNRDGTDEQILDNLNALNFSVRIDSVAYTLKLEADNGHTYSLQSRLRLLNANYRGAWSLNEGHGRNTADSSFNNNEGEVSSPSDWTSAGKTGPAYQFDGTDSHVEIEDHSSLDSSDHLGVAAWVNGNSYTGTRTIFNRGTPWYYIWWFQFPDSYLWVYIENDRIKCDFRAGEIRTVSSNALTWTPNQWYRVYVQLDGVDNRVHFYRGGTLVGEASFDGDFWRVNPVNPGAAYIGAYQQDQDNWDGVIDDVRYTSP